MIRTKIDPTYDSAKTTWSDIQYIRTINNLFLFLKHILEEQDIILTFLNVVTVIATYAKLLGCH